MSSKNSFVPTIENMVKEGINDMKKNVMWWRKPSIITRGEIKLTP